tara:strand:- start:565 stop:957 length:393 start_codon:yes stop_codon:yes gene_type:complete
MESINLEQLIAPIAQHLGAVGTGIVVALVLVFRLLKSWLEFKRARDAAENENSSSEEIETLMEIVAENETEDAKEEAAIIESVNTLSEEVATIRDAQNELRREIRRLQRIAVDQNEMTISADSDMHDLDP